MTPGVVVDIGNTAIKWGRCSSGRVTDICILPPGDVNAWQRQIEHWELPAATLWVLTSVQPQQCAALERYLRERGHRVHLLTLAASLPLQVRLDQPDYVGIDRLLDAVAANSRRSPGTPAVIVDAGSAVTVDWLDAEGAFGGGAILPGLRLMAAALHEHTALLPLIPAPRQAPPLPGTTTIAAMEVGIFWAVAGGVRALIEQYAAISRVRLQVFVTGGDGQVLHSVLGASVEWWPTMTLEGIRLSAEALP
jgi:type III pantothenate kinase